ncbi:MAG: ATP-dependent Clp protease ATP-binding subunit ClpC, partial [Agathobacter sp.]|nr:ATP-dependent Clp protease ATP-binding subunit ClpC [Agathobacter sp.]
MHYNYVGTEHVLAGLLKEGTGVAAEVLSVNGVEISKLLQMMEELISIGQDTIVAERDGYSPRTQHILEKSEEEARKLGYENIGTEHILLAIIKEGDCAASRLLNTMGINLQKLFTDTLSAMGEDPAKYREEYTKSKNAAKSGSSTPTLDQ